MQTIHLKSSKGRPSSVEANGQDAAWPPQYSRMLKRLGQLDGVLEQDVRAARADLFGWYQEALVKGADVLAPWVFANNDHKIEFEWESAAGILTLTQGDENMWSYSLCRGEADEEEGITAAAGVTELLMKLFGA